MQNWETMTSLKLFLKYLDHFLNIVTINLNEFTILTQILARLQCAVSDNHRREKSGSKKEATNAFQQVAS